jgi:hypothetical protein
MTDFAWSLIIVGSAVGLDGKPMGNDDLTTIWVANPPREGFVFKQYETPHAYATSSAELNGEPMQEEAVGIGGNVVAGEVKRGQIPPRATPLLDSQANISGRALRMPPKGGSPLRANQ